LLEKGCFKGERILIKFVIKNNDKDNHLHHMDITTPSFVLLLILYMYFTLY